MNNSNESFLDVVDEAMDGRLQLPSFQRDYKWHTNQVAALYDSLRKKYPVGSMLLLSSDAKVNFDPRVFEGVDKRKKNNCYRLPIFF